MNLHIFIKSLWKANLLLALLPGYMAKISEPPHLTTKLPKKKMVKPSQIKKKFLAVTGGKFLFIRLSISALYNMGCTINEIKTTATIPIIVMAAIDLSAGCFENKRTPKPMVVIIADRKIEDL